MKKSDAHDDTRQAGLAREKQLRLIVKRLQVRGTSGEPTKVTFAAVAREAGVSTALIHNHYPQVAELIRTVQGRASRAQRNSKHEELKAEKAKTKALREEVDDLRQKLRSLVSINETLAAELEEARSRQHGGNVVNFAPQRPRNR